MTWQKQTTWKQEGEADFLLKEDAFFLLLEDGGKIIIRDYPVIPTAWEKLTVSPGIDWLKLTPP